MTAFQVLITTGTPDTGWAAVAGDWLRAACPHDLALEPFSRWVREQHGAPPQAVPGFGRAGAPVWGGLDAAAAPLLPALGRRFPRAHALLWLQPPEECLAAWIAGGGHGDAAAVLAPWRAAAEAMLGHLQRHHERSLMLDVAEWRAHPGAAGERLSAFLGLPAPAAWPAPPPAPEPLPLALAGALMAGRADLQRLHAECLAACVPLADAGPGGVPALRSAFGERELALAADQWRQTQDHATQAQRQLAAAQAEAARAQAQHAAALAEARAALERQRAEAAQTTAQHEAALAEARTALERQRADAAQTTAQHEAALAEARTALERQRAEATQTTAQHEAALAEARAALERQRAEAAQAQARHDARAQALEAQGRSQGQALADSQTALAALQAEHARLTADHASTRAELAAAHAELARARQSQATLQATHDALVTEHDTVVDTWLALQERWLQGQAEAAQAQSQMQARLAQLQTEQRTMLRHLHEQQDQIDRTAREREQLAALGSPLRADTVTLRALEAGPERDQPPHCEIGFVLHDVQAPDRTHPRVLCRLVEHHGRAGLALLQAPGGEPPLRAWAPSGQEDGRDFVLLIPQDDDGRRRLESLGTSDRLFVEAIAARLEAALAGDRLRGPRWRPVALQLREQLWREPPRWRYDRLEVRAVDGGHLLAFREVLCGGFRAHGVELMWRPGHGGAAALMWPADATDPPLLSAWPRGDDGRLLPACPLPLDTGGPRAERRARWRALPPADRELVLAMLQALAGMAAGQPAPDGVDAAAWRTLPGLLQAALRLQHGGRLRRVLDAARGRIAGGR